ncbi:NAD(P)-dependent dehydrogenase (short-subunit alcohol dehydrogenase family) [Paenibacillus phyllosphaerae]|uniref:NAD(P)-dependent dehydrogenase (Short-subunit alcohol dehydrogenase family) n=1 Tax=Paenibacillus phyllosphaerae TaxID=274593 RepID=A0A7W5FQH4_9BACL|nr:SDR family oxidoreductase [Paenibacillus phyllosphaerae]MBB3113039.1 NAD(P)-dependent dehydrogenase (short-subunit alcohol dehydrogenase family) [Paenibacillus phyllosphaerae]
MRLSNKVVFITDAGSESGRALSLRLAQDGAHLVLNSKANDAGIPNLAQACRAFGSQVVVVRADLRHRASIAGVLEQVSGQLGFIDILLHNNSSHERASVEDGSEDGFLRVLRENAKTAFCCTQAIGGQMADRGSGTVLYLGSIHAEKPSGAAFSYSVSQGAIQMLAQEAALFLGRHGVQVNYLQLGPMDDADRMFGSTISALYDNYRRKIPGGAVGTYDELASIISFLGTGEARCLNGACLRLDGGFLLHYMDHKMAKPVGEEDSKT